MLKIKVFTIEKRSDDALESVCGNFIKQISRYANIQASALFSQSITQAQSKCPDEAKVSYSKIYEPHLQGGYNIALHERGEKMSSDSFSKLLDGHHSCVNFFLGGAYGFEEAFLKKFDRTVSLSDMTMGHKIAKTVLFEQIYRAMAILAGHPYHK